MVEEHRTDVIQVTVEGEEASSCLVRPHLDLVVVAAGDEERLSPVEVDATDRTIMLFKSINQGAHTIIPKLNGGRVQGDEDPWSGLAILALFESVVA